MRSLKQVVLSSFPRSVLAIILIASVSSIAFAQPKVEESAVTLETVLSHALVASPLVKEIDAKTSERLAQALTLRILPNPELSGGVLFPFSSPGAKNQYSASLTQPFRISHLGLRDTVSSLIENAASVEQKISLLELTQNVRLAYVKLWALQRQRIYMVEAKDRAKQIRGVVSDRNAKGLFGKGEEGLFTAEYERALADLIGLSSEIKKAEATLLRLSTFSTSGLLLSRPNVAGSLDLNAIAQNTETNTLPIQERVSLLERVSKEQVKLAKRDSFPALAPQLSYSRNEDGFDFVGVGLTVELPLFNRNQAEQLQRSAELKAASAKREYFQGESFRTEVELLVESYRGSLAQAESYENKVIPALEGSISTYEKQLRSGQGTVLLVWQTQRELLELQRLLLENWVKVFSTQAELVILTGKEF